MSHFRSILTDSNIDSKSEGLHNDMPCVWSTATQKAAEDCLQRRGYFYDACSNTCQTEMSLLRLSHEEHLEHLIYGRVFPVLVLIVVVANVLVALVLSRKHMITPTNVVLYYMAVADLCVGIVPLPWNLYYHTFRYNEREDKLKLWWCYMYKYSMDVVPPVCHNIAMWLTVLLAGQRYISIEYPLRSRQICRVHCVRTATVVIAAASLICGLPKSFDYYYDVFEGWAFVEPGRWIYTRSCTSSMTPLVHAIGPNMFFNCYFWTRVFGFIILPSILLIVLNVLLMRGIRKAQKRKEHLLNFHGRFHIAFRQCVFSWSIFGQAKPLEKRAREAQRQIDSNSTSLMLVMVVSIFLVVNLPQAIFMGLLCVYNTFGIQNRLLEGMFPVAFMLASNMLVMLTYPINFGIYCFMSSSFRQTFRQLFCRGQGQFGPNRNSGGNIATTSLFTRILIRHSDPSHTQLASSVFNSESKFSNTLLPPPPLGLKSGFIEDKNHLTPAADTIYL